MWELYELQEQFERLLHVGNGAAVDEEAGEIWTPEMIDALQMTWDEKIKNCVFAIRNYLASAKAKREEAAILTDGAKAAENNAKRLKDYVGRCLGGKPHKAELFSLTWQPSEAVEIDEGAILPNEYTTPQPPKPNKTAIKTAIKAGAVIPGARLVKNNNLVLRMK